MTRKDFNELVHNQYRKLYFIAFRLVRNRQEAEDIVQEVFTRMWSLGLKLDEYNDVVALAVTMTKNISIDLLRKMKHIDSGTELHEVKESDFALSPLDQMVSTETAEILTCIIESLPSGFKEIVQMKDISGLSYEEIADKTKMNINTLRVNLSRARRIIREEYLKYGKRGKTETTSGELL